MTKARLYDPDVATNPRPSDSLILRFAKLTDASPTRPRDAVLRAFDLFLSALFLLVSLPLIVPIALAILLTSGRPLFYRGRRVGRGGQIFEMLKFRTLRPGAEERLGPHLGEARVLEVEVAPDSVDDVAADHPLAPELRQGSTLGVKQLAAQTLVVLRLRLDCPVGLVVESRCEPVAAESVEAAQPFSRLRADP